VISVRIASGALIAGTAAAVVGCAPTTGASGHRGHPGHRGRDFGTPFRDSFHGIALITWR
jgi:hypothetical protein